MSDSDSWLNLMREAWGTDMPFFIDVDGEGVPPPQQPPNPFAAPLAAAALRWANVAQDDPAGASNVELQTLAATRLEITGLLAAVPTEQGVAAVEGRIDSYVATRQRAVAGAKARADRAELVARCPPEQKPDGADDTQIERIRAKRAAITGMPETPGVVDLANARQALADLPGLVATIGKEITERRVKVRGDIIATLPADVAPDGADPGQVDRLRAQRELVTKMPVTPSEVDLEKARQDVLGLTALIATIGKEITERRVKVRGDIIATLPADVAPDGADPGQVDRLRAQRELVTKMPVTPSEVDLEKARQDVIGLTALIATIEKEISDRRIKARADLVAQAVAIPNPAAADPAQLKRIATVRAKIKAVPAVPNDARLKDGTDALAELKTLLADIGKEIVAAEAARAAMANAQAALKDAFATLPPAEATVLKNKLTTPIADLAKAKLESEFQAVKVAADTFVIAANAARNYGTELAKLTVGRPKYDIASGIAAGGAGNPVDAALATAAGQAAAGNFADALATITTFKTTGPAGQVTEVFEAVEAFRGSDSGRKLARMKNAAVKPPGFNGGQLDNLLAAARDPVIKANPQPADVNAAKQQIANFKATVDGFAAYQDRKDELTKLKTSAAYVALGVLPWKANVDAKETEANAGPVTTPIATRTGKLVDAINLIPADIRPYLTAYNKFEPHFKAIGDDPARPGTDYAKDQYAKKVQAEVAKSDFSKATAAIGILQSKLIEITNYRAADAGFAAAAGTLDPGRVTTLRAAADAAVKLNNYAGAEALISAAANLARKWVAYQVRRDAVDLLVKAADPTQRGEIDPFVKRADIRVAADDPDGALAILNELRQVDAVSDLDGKVADGLKRLAAVEAAVARATKLLPALAGPLAVPVKAVSDALKVNHDAADGLAKLKIAEDQVKLATEYATLHKAMTATMKGLGPPPVTDITDAEVLAAASKFTEAKAKLTTLGTTVEARCAAKAGALEIADGGHSLAAHGKQTVVNDPDCQKNRVKTGARPDGVNMPTKFATNFTSDEAWLTTRQLAADELKAKFGIDISTTVNTASGVTYTELTAIIEHNRPIGSAVAGVKPKYVLKTGGPQKGEGVPEQKFDPVEEWTGLTRTRSVFKWDAGRWKCHQNFPHADDWDDVNKCYTEPVPEPSFK
jgi:hypothetical protein